MSNQARTKGHNLWWCMEQEKSYLFYFRKNVYLFISLQFILGDLYCKRIYGVLAISIKTIKNSGYRMLSGVSCQTRVALTMAYFIFSWRCFIIHKTYYLCSFYYYLLTNIWKVDKRIKIIFAGDPYPLHILPIYSIRINTSFCFLKK